MISWALMGAAGAVLWATLLTENQKLISGMVWASLALLWVGAMVYEYA
jgi:hypothetical protein